MKRLLIATLGSLFLSPFVHAGTDSNGNGMTDAWELRFNGSQLFSASVLPGDDADGDGVSNLDENLAGTDPFHGTPPTGFLRADVRHVPAVYTTPVGGGDPELVSPEAFVISWPTQFGKLYTLHASPDLSPDSWIVVGESEYGDGQEIEIATLPTYQDGTVADRFFWRVAVADVDSDGDGFSDYDEGLKGTSISVADRDDDWMPDDWEDHYDLDPDDNGTNHPELGPYGDRDGDGLSNIDEYRHGTSPNLADTDSDNLTDFEELSSSSTVPTKADTDGDGISDGLEDSDYDGLTNLEELRTYGTKPSIADTDEDRLLDGWEIAHGFDPLTYNSVTDPDNDDLDNAQEQRLGLNPLDSDTDDDGISDGAEDQDGDNLTNLAEISIHLTDPIKADTDNDGLDDRAELTIHLTSPTKHDTDGDALPDGWEIEHSINPRNTTGVHGTHGDPDNDHLDNFHEWINGCDPHDSDTDGDGMDDLTEVTRGSDPNDPADGGSSPEDGVQEVDFEVYGDLASWRMEIKGEGPDDRRKILVVTPAVGAPETGTVKLRRNNKYTITLHHTGSSDQAGETWYCWEALVDGMPWLATFRNYLPERIPKVGMFFSIGEGHWLVDNRDGLFSTHNHRTERDGGNAVAGLKATLLPMETLVGDPADIENAPEGFVSAEAVPVPSVEMTVTSSALQGSDLEIRLQGTVRDSVSKFAGSSAEWPETLDFYHQDELLHSIPLDDTVGDGFTFDETVVVPDAKPQTYVIRAETTANIAGEKGYDESSVSLTWEEDPSSFPASSTPPSIAFSTAPAATAVDQVTLFFGNGSPQPGDSACSETTADSLTFNGNLRIPASPEDLTAPCQLEIEHPGVFSTTEIDSVFVKLEFSAPGFPRNRMVGRWIETAPDSLVFRAGSRVLGNVALKTSQAANRNLRGTPASDIEAGTIRFASLPSDIAEDLQVVSGGIAYDLLNKNGDWFPEDPDEPGEIKRFMPSALPVPQRLEAPGYNPRVGALEFQLRYPGIPDIHATDILVVPGGEEEESAPPGATGVSVYSLDAASEETPDPWQPGNPVIPEHVIWAYKFLNAGDSFAEELLNGYLRGGHRIATGNVFGDLKTSVDWGDDLSTHKDNIRTIYIEKDIHPILAARLLFEGLKEMYLHDEVADDFEWEDPMDEIAAFQAAAAIAVLKTQQTAIAATELYLSGLGIVNEGLDWILVVNDLAEGEWESLAAALPFIPAGLVKTGSHLIIRKGSSEVIDTLDTDGFEALKQLYRESDLRVMGVTMDEYEFSDSLRKSLSTSSGPIPVPVKREELRKSMETIGPKPQGKFVAHHDFIWCERRWFAAHGIDVNNPAFGRWVSKYDHHTWHSGIGMGEGGRFNEEWRKFIRNEQQDAANGVAYSYTEIIDKLANIRAQFPVTGGHD